MMQLDPSALYRGARLAQALECAKTYADEIRASENFLAHQTNLLNVKGKAWQKPKRDARKKNIARRCNGDGARSISPGR